MKITWKKLLTLSLAAVMALSLAACGGNDSSDQSANQTQEEAAPPADTAENGAGPESSGDGAAAADGNVLVVYYSASGNTETAANYIAQAAGGDIFEITPTEPYTSDDLNWTDDNSRVSREHEDESLRDVELTTTEVENWDSYDTVFIGYPIWWGIAAWPVDGFVEANDFQRQDGHPLLHLLQLRPGPERRTAGPAGRHRRLAGGTAVPLQRQSGGCKRVGGQPGAVRRVRKRQGAGATGSGFLL